MSQQTLTGIHAVKSRYHMDMWQYLGSFVRKARSWVDAWKLTEN